MIAAALALDSKGLVPTAEEIQAAQQQAQQQAMLEKLGPNVINAVGGLAKQQAMHPGA